MAMRSMLGMLAASKGVFPPSSLSGSSAAPSGMMMAYFIFGSLCEGRGGMKIRGDLQFAICDLQLKANGSAGCGKVPIALNRKLQIANLPACSNLKQTF